MNTKLILRITDFEEAIKDLKSGLYSEAEFELKIREIADEIVKLVPKDRFEAGMTKEEREELGERLFPFAHLN